VLTDQRAILDDVGSSSLVDSARAACQREANSAGRARRAAPCRAGRRRCGGDVAAALGCARQHQARPGLKPRLNVAGVEEKTGCGRPCLLRDDRSIDRLCRGGRPGSLDTTRASRLQRCDAAADAPDAPPKDLVESLSALTYSQMTVVAVDNNGTDVKLPATSAAAGA